MIGWASPSGLTWVDHQRGYSQVGVGKLTVCLDRQALFAGREQGYGVGGGSSLDLAKTFRIRCLPLTRQVPGRACHLPVSPGAPSALAGLLRLTLRPG